VTLPVAAPRRSTLSVALVLALAVSLVGLPATAARGPDAQPSTPAAPPTIDEVTLVTGDVVRVIGGQDGRTAIALEPGPDGTIPQASITRTKDHVHVVPRVAMPLLAAGKLDRDLFDVTGLIAQRYDDADTSTIPVIVDFGQGAAATNRANSATFTDARKTVKLPKLGAAAFKASKAEARDFWRSVTAAPDAMGAPTKLAQGATRLDLDRRVRALLDTSVPQIGAPEAWAEGYDGTGATVAVLDTGYDAGHPDLQDTVVGSANFSTNPTVADGHGHGTHVASTIAGNGAASGGLYKGVAPGTDLLIGKVLDDTGFGEDSAVMAGMEWAVAQGADVVSMSLGSEPTDGTDPLSQAVNDLSAASDTLFVIAAGNAGSEPGTVSAPGSAEAALTVAAVDDGDFVAWFSSRGPRVGDRGLKPDVSAPGVSVVAARAAGTELGTPVDDDYTSLEGTSMATPHVAGMAAILKQLHPAWDGEQLKALITETTVPVHDATGFDTGSGRISVPAALDATVLVDPSLELGWFPFPQTSSQGTQTPLTYTNTGTTDVTFALSIAAEDGVGEAPAGVSLSADTVTVPAGGTATVELVLDPSIAAKGNSSGVVFADTVDGSDLRTAFGFSIEDEMYDLTVVLGQRPGTQRSSHSVSLVGLPSFSFQGLELAANGDADQSVTFRVPPGLYGLGDTAYVLAADGGIDGVLTEAPSVRVKSDMTVELDSATAERFDYRVDHPVLNDGMVMTVDWDGTDGFLGWGIAGAVDRLYAAPLASNASGRAAAALNWLLSQPDAELRWGKELVALRVLTGEGQRSWDTPIPALNGRYGVVDAGPASALRTKLVKGKIAIVGGSCTDLTAAAATLKAAGAAAMVAYPAPGAACAGTVQQPAPLPAFQARPFAITAMLKHGQKKGDVVSRPSPTYMYDLAAGWDNGVPAGATIDARDAKTAAIVERYDSMGGTSAESGLRLYDIMIGWLPGRDAAAFGLVRPVPVPGTVTHRVSPIAAWERIVQVNNQFDSPEALFTAPRIDVAAGATVNDRWFHGPVASRVSPQMAQLGDYAQPSRSADTMYLYQPQWTDAGGHMGSALWLGEFEGRVYQDGELIMQGDDPLWLWGQVPAERHRYRVEFKPMRQTDFWRRSTTSTTSWEFDSEAPKGELEVLPLVGVAYDMPLSAMNTAPAGAFEFGLRFTVPETIAPRPLTAVTADLSWDGGTSWAPADLTGCQPGAPAAVEINGSQLPADGASSTVPSCRVRVTNPAGGSAAIRVTATDDAGRVVEQTIVDAYAVEP
jgi:subtilisin family serine protease